MRIKIFLFFATVIFTSFYTSGQQPLPVPSNFKKAYEQGTRTADGKPGKNYWQNTADYDLKINFDPETRMLRGSEEVEYTNNSPDTLWHVYFKLYPNIYKKGSERNMSVKSEDLTDGVEISSFIFNNQVIQPDKFAITGTNMIVSNISILPKQKVHFTISWSYTLNKTSHLRTGEIDQGADFVAYFFPRIAVYDDIDGWNSYPYLGKQEFYNDFCHFKVSVTVPNDQLVWATGDLLNAPEVLTPKYYQRLQKAEATENIITVIDSAEISEAVVRTKPFNTWQFQASDVTDFVFACSDHYMWQSTSVLVDKSSSRRTRVDAVFNPAHRDYFDVIHFARKTVEAMSYDFPKWPYPYPHETIFDGLDQMEYPMMVNDNPLSDHAETVELTDHEIFHTMFPFYMGINETKYAWMDEGWATIGEWVISPLIDSILEDRYGVDAVSNTAGIETDLPIITPSTEINKAYFANSYPKPAMAYLFIKDMLGDTVFHKGLHYYIQQWHGKHPIPLDFFNCMNTGSGRNMNWFWRKWFYENGTPELAISKVLQSGNQKQIFIESKGSKPVPVDLTVTFTDGSTKKIHRSIAAWEKGNKTTIIKIAGSKGIKSLELGGTYIPDTNKKNNYWPPVH